MSLDENLMDDGRIIDIPERVEYDDLGKKSRRRIDKAIRGFYEIERQVRPTDPDTKHMAPITYQKAIGDIGLSLPEALIVCKRLVYEAESEGISDRNLDMALRSIYINNLLQYEYDIDQSDRFRIETEDLHVPFMYEYLNGTPSKPFEIIHHGKLGAFSLANSKHMSVLIDGDTDQFIGIHLEDSVLRIMGQGGYSQFNSAKRCLIDFEGDIGKYAFMGASDSHFRARSVIGQNFGTRIEGCIIETITKEVPKEFMFLANDCVVYVESIEGYEAYASYRNHAAWRDYTVVLPLPDGSLMISEPNKNRIENTENDS